MSSFFSDYARFVFLLIEPIGLLWLTLGVLTIQLWRNRLRGFAAVTGAMFAALLLIGSTPFPDALLRSLERPYIGVKLDDLPAADAVVVLGGFAGPSRYEVGGVQLTDAIDRAVTALEVIRLRKARILVIGGGGAEVDGKVLVDADLVASLLRERSNFDGEIISLGRCADTHDEAIRTRDLAQKRGWQRLHLVTSATHLKRASATFRTAGLDVISVPSDFVSSLSRPPSKTSFAPPGWLGFSKVSIWLHEQIGWLEYRRRGWIDPAKLGGAAR